MPKTLIVIVTYNGISHIKACLENTFTEDEDLSFMIIDNGSTDGTVKYIKEHYPTIKVLENGRNLGFGEANNIGLRFALQQDYEYIYLLNQDAWISPASIKELIRIAENNRDYGIISPLQVYAGEKKLDKNFSSNITKEIKDDYLLHSENKKDIYRISNKTLQAAHWLLPVSAVRKVGGFSPSFFHYGEDTNLCRRMEFHGFKLGIAAGINAVHNRENRVNPSGHYFLLSTNEWRKAVSDPNYTKKIVLKILLEKMMLTLFYYPGRFAPALFKFIKDLRKLISNRRISVASETPFL